MTSGASVFHTEGGTTEYDDYEDDATDLDWNGSDLFSVASYGRRSTGMVGGGGSQYGGRRRTTLQDLPDIMAHQDINTGERERYGSGQEGTTRSFAPSCARVCGGGHEHGGD